ncbi:MAG: Mrp/NBP35 family ATP-binding protein [Christensenellales bacterium]|jgi:Mrp family chromosome partitioning ATPase
MSTSCEPEKCGTMAKCEGCASNKSGQAPQNKGIIEQPIKKVFAVVSGKGGVGKSSVTALLASAARRRNLSVGVLDADITGPSMPRMFGAKDPVKGDGEKMLPARTMTGIELMSVNLLLESEDTPVIWRGPILAGVIQQFWNDVRWSELDVMFIDMPPGTGDVPLTVFQSLPIDGIIVVTTPQDLVGMIVKKAVRMAEMMNIPVLGLVENMSYMECPDCKKRLYPFGKGKTEYTAKEMGLPLLARLPINPVTADFSDTGRIELADVPEIEPALDAILK